MYLKRLGEPSVLHLVAAEVHGSAVPQQTKISPFYCSYLQFADVFWLTCEFNSFILSQV